MNLQLFNEANTANRSLEETLFKMLQEIEHTNLIEVLTDRLGDPLVKYRTNDGTSIDPIKVPSTLYHVAIMTHLREYTMRFNWGFAQENGTIYVFTGKYWELLPTDLLRKFLSGVSIKMGCLSNAEAMTHNYLDGLGKQFIQSVDIFKRKHHDHGTILVNLNNGTLEITSHGSHMREHRREDYLTYCLNFGYDETAQCPQYKTYLDRVLPDTSLQHILQEFHGYVFTRGLKLEKALILLGEGANGKSVQYEITRALFGDVNISTKSLGDLMDRDSGNDNRAKLKDKLINYGSEIRADALDTDIFKRLVSGEPVMAREKYKSSFDLENVCKFVFNANRLPQAVEHSHAYFRRFLIIPYSTIIPEDERDPELHTKIISTELSGILNWVIEGLHRLLANKRFSDSTASNSALDQYKNETNTILLFIDETGIEKDDSARMPSKQLYDLYTQWCSGSGMKKVNSIIFGKELISMGFEPYRTNAERGYKAKRSVAV
jgi:putative DNA primase/helicase